MIVNDSNEEIIKCAICLETIKIKSKNDGCEHIFCKSCILNWIVRSSSCPLCKSEIGQIIVSEPDYKTIRKIKPKKFIIDDNEENEIESICCAESCLICKKSNDEHLLLICDECNWNTSHTYCAGLEVVPHENWYCNLCEDEKSKNNMSKKIPFIVSDQINSEVKHFNDEYEGKIQEENDMYVEIENYISCEANLKQDNVSNNNQNTTNFKKVGKIIEDNLDKQIEFNYHLIDMEKIFDARKTENIQDNYFNDNEKFEPFLESKEQTHLKTYQNDLIEKIEQDTQFPVKILHRRVCKKIKRNRREKNQISNTDVYKELEIPGNTERVLVNKLSAVYDNISDEKLREVKDLNSVDHLQNGDVKLYFSFPKSKKITKNSA